MPGRESECSGTGRRSPVPELLLPGDPDTPCGYRRLAPAPEASRNASDPQDGPVPSVRTEVLMARITVEDCAQFVDNRFALCILGTRRARQLASGATPLVQTQRNKSAVVALREVATGKVRFEGDVRAALSKPPPETRCRGSAPVRHPRREHRPRSISPKCASIPSDPMPSEIPRCRNGEPPVSPSALRILHNRARRPARHPTRKGLARSAN